MKPKPIFVAAAGFAMLGACNVTTTDNSADNSTANGDETAASPGGGNVLPAADENAQADTLGNQLDQLNADAENSAAAETNTTNSD